jgi:hypothetical protein
MPNGARYRRILTLLVTAGLLLVAFLLRASDTPAQTLPQPTATTQYSPKSIPKLRVVLYLPKITSRRNGVAHVVAFATNAVGGRLKGLKLTFRWGTGGCSATTDDSGRASCHTVASQNRTLKVTFAGDDRYAAAEATGSMLVADTPSGQLTPPKGAKVLLESILGRTNRGVYLRARTIGMSDGRPAKGIKVAFYAGGFRLGAGVSNADGVVRMTIPGGNINLSRFLKSGDLQNGMLEASTTTGPPAMAIAQLSLYYKNDYNCPDPAPSNGAPSWVPVKTQKCSVRTGATHPVIVAPAATVMLKRAYSNVAILSKSPGKIRVTTPPAPAKNAGCTTSGCTAKCAYVGYKGLNADLLTVLRGNKNQIGGCLPSKNYDVTVHVDGLDSKPFKLMAWDRCTITAPAGLSATSAWNHDTTLNMQLAVVPTFAFMDYYMSSSHQIWGSEQIIADAFFIVNVPVKIKCR